MKFGDIKKGDVVMHKSIVRYGRYSVFGSYWVKGVVSRTTKTMFFLENGGRYRKETGLEVGGGFNRVEAVGSVPDEQDKYNDAVSMVVAARAAKAASGELHERINPGTKDVKEIRLMLEKALEVMNGGVK